VVQANVMRIERFIVFGAFRKKSLYLSCPSVHKGQNSNYEKFINEGQYFVPVWPLYKRPEKFNKHI
jgi:hypothetical protein